MSTTMEKVITFLASMLVGLFVIAFLGCILAPVYLLWGWTGILFFLGAAALWVLLVLSVLWLSDEVWRL